MWDQITTFIYYQDVPWWIRNWNSMPLLWTEETILCTKWSENCGSDDISFSLVLVYFFLSSTLSHCELVILLFFPPIEAKASQFSITTHSVGFCDGLRGTITKHSVLKADKLENHTFPWRIGEIEKLTGKIEEYTRAKPIEEKKLKHKKKYYQIWMRKKKNI